MQASWLGIAPDVLALALVAGVLAFVTVRAPAPPLSAPLRALIAGVWLFLAGGVVEEGLPGADGSWGALTLLYGGHMIVSPAWFLLCVRCTEMHGRPLGAGATRLARWAAFAFAGFFLLLVTNPWHQQFLIPRLLERNLYQPLWYVYTACAYGLTFGGIAILGRLAWSPPSAEARRQAALWIGAALMPALANLAYLLLPFPSHLDPTPAGYGLSSLVLTAGAVRRDFLSLGPVGLAGLFDRDSDAIVLMDARGSISYANPTARRWFPEAPLHPGELLSAALGSRLRWLGENGPIGEEALQTLLNGDVRPATLLEAIGEGRTLRFERLPLAMQRFGRSSVAVRLRDETQLVRASQAVAEQASTLEAVLACSDDAFVIVDAEGELLYANQRTQQLYGVDNDVDRWESPVDFWKEVSKRLEDPDAIRREVATVTRRPFVTRTFDLRLREGAWLETTVTPLVREGRFAGRVWQTRDRTTERMAEEHLRNTQKLESLGVMAGGIAHDFNNLLVGVLGNAELARMSLPEGSECAEPLSAIQLAAERAGDLTRQLLAYAGRDDSASFEQIDLVELVRETRELIAVSVPKNVRMDMEMPEGQAVVHGDASQLRQVLMNLMINAAEAIGGRQGRIGVAICFHKPDEPRAPEGARPEELCLRVEDDGCGMDEETRNRLFDPFFTTKFEGRGLGLAATLGIVRTHGGTLRVESEAGQGTRIEVFLPAHPEPESSAEEGEAAPWQGSGRILVVDDEPAVRRVSEKMLERIGFEVTGCGDGHRALFEIAAQPDRYEAVLLDIAMPALSGIEVARILATRHPGVPVVLCSGQPPEPGDVPVAGFLRKPFTRAQLADALRGALA